MKLAFALFASLVVIASAQTSSAASCPFSHKGGRKPTIEPKTTVVRTQTVQSTTIRR
jgi:hypothetical protein